MIPAAVIVDTQNFYGNSNRVLGPRCKPDPDGVVDAFSRLGFRVQELHIAVAKPDPSDESKAIQRVDRLRKEIERVGDRIAAAMGLLISIPTAHQPANAADQSCARAIAGLRGLAVSLGRTRGPTLVSNLLRSVNAAANDVRSARGELEDALRILDGLKMPSVASDVVRGALAIGRAQAGLSALARRLQEISSYLYASGENWLS